MPGMMVAGKPVDVPNVRVINSSDAAWAHPGLNDSRPRTRRTTSGALIWPQMGILHKTIADDPEKLLQGAGPSARAGGAEDTVEAWQKDPAYSGAQLVTGHDGTVVCVADLVFVEAFHAEAANPYSYGHETKELLGGGFYEAAALSTVLTTIAACDALGIQKQIPHLGTYGGHPIKRMINGGHDCVGIFGHRDQTEKRGRWDPGDYLFSLLAAHGFEQFDFDHGEDIATWKARQLSLNAQGAKLLVDGIPGPATRAALLAAGYKNGLWVNGR